MPLEQVSGTVFNPDDQIDLHRADGRLAPYEEIVATAPDRQALERQKAKTAEYFQTVQGQIALLSLRTVELRQQAADSEKPLDPRLDLGTREDYELVG